jgi:hypothetical protein
MQTAQRLYEAGHITYMRTDGVSMDEGAIRELRTAIGRRFGKELRARRAARYASKIKNAQEAHEAIRPTDPSNTPQQLSLDGDHGEALRSDLEARCRLADGSRFDRAHQRRFHRADRQASNCAPPAKSFSSTAS